MGILHTIQKKKSTLYILHKTTLYIMIFLGKIACGIVWETQIHQQKYLCLKNWEVHYVTKHKRSLKENAESLRLHYHYDPVFHVLRELSV